jgi:hypothetical protein
VEVSSVASNRPFVTRTAGCAAVFALGLSLYWLVVFLNTFNVLGLPVRNNKYGWLGPTPWVEESAPFDKKCAVDAGKINDWECADVSVFRRHRFGCWLWLKLNGFTLGDTGEVE